MTGTATGLAAAALLVAVALGTGGSSRRATAAEGMRPFAAFAPDGHAWAAMSEGEKLRYLEGFLAGHALAQAAAAGVPVDRLRRDGALAYPFAPTVYKTRLEDHLFYTDRRDRPLHEALAAVNDQLKTAPRR